MILFQYNDSISRSIFLFFFLIVLSSQSVFAEDKPDFSWLGAIDFGHEFQANLSLNQDKTNTEAQSFVRYLGEVNFQDIAFNHLQSRDYQLDAHLSLNLALTYQDSNNNTDNFDTQLGVYRAWVRLFKGNSLEAKIGRMEIAFGPGRIFRPLAWFDNLSFLDPFNFTTGRNALLLRYEDSNGQITMGWLTFANDEPLGYMMDREKQDSIGAGGRFQQFFESANLEVGFTYHQYEAEQIDLNATDVNLSKIGLDFSWDTPFDFSTWSEQALTYSTSNDNASKPWQIASTLGADYTLGIGNGVLISLEGLYQENGGRSLDFLNYTLASSALFGSYSLSLMDQFNAVLNYGHAAIETLDMSSDFWNAMLIWQRSYDLWFFWLGTYYAGTSDARIKPFSNTASSFQAHALSTYSEQRHELGIQLLFQVNL